MFGLINKDLKIIKDVFKKFKEIDEAIVFGSRAIGNYKKGSDIDITLFGDNINLETLYKIDEELNEIQPIPYFFDIIIYKEIKNENLKNHINTYGKLIYKKDTI